jgi:hypothetical protein
MLSLCDESTLTRLALKLELFGIDTERFREPDRGGALTAIAASGPGAARRLRGFSLLFQGGGE